MTITEINELFESASKVLHMDKSHDAIRSNVQAALSAQHRKDNAASDSSSYYNTPYVRDVFGTEDAGQVVHQKDGKMTLSKYKKDAKGNYNLSDHKPVKHAYVVDPDAANENKESMSLLIDGQHVSVKSESAPLICSEVLDLQEADGKSSTAKLTLISAGKGSSGYYTESALKKAAKDGIFTSGTQMFLNHQTKEERLARPEGDVTKLAAVLTGKAEYVEGANGKPGRLVAPAKIYPEFSPFIASRKDDIGVSIRVGAENSGKMQEGVPLVENMVYALSADFVTKAGRGGKIEELYESYREQNPGTQSSGNPPQENQAMTDEEKSLFTKLQESLATLTTQNAAQSVRLDRLAEQNERFSASSIVSEALSNCGLSARGKDRVTTVVLASLPMKEDKTLDVAKLKESVAAAVTDEKSYLQEAGVAPRTSPVRYLGGGSIKLVNEADNKPRSDEDILKDADALLQESVNGILGKETKTA